METLCAFGSCHLLLCKPFRVALNCIEEGVSTLSSVTIVVVHNLPASFEMKHSRRKVDLEHIFLVIVSSVVDLLKLCKGNNVDNYDFVEIYGTDVGGRSIKIGPSHATTAVYPN